MKTKKRKYGVELACPRCGCKMKASKSYYRTLDACARADFHCQKCQTSMQYND